jgi:hypothetical protein
MAQKTRERNSRMEICCPKSKDRGNMTDYVIEYGGKPVKSIKRAFKGSGGAGSAAYGYKPPHTASQRGGAYG